MKILFTGGGTGGHFYPIIAIAQALRELSRQQKLIPPELHYFAPSPYHPGLLADHRINYQKVPCGKFRRYFSWLNFSDLFKTFWGVLLAFLKIFRLYPDVVFGKGGFGSFPTLLSARLLGIPIIIHESDARPGKINSWAAGFARRIAVSFPETAKFFPPEKTAHTGQPVRRSLLEPPEAEKARQLLNLEEGTPTILVLGGSQGAQLINEVILQALPKILEKYQLIQQTGSENFSEVKNRAGVILAAGGRLDRFHPLAYLNDQQLKMAAGAAQLVISRAGSTIFEIALWGLPSIIIPISQSAGDHQRQNAYSYAKAGACSIIEEANLSTAVLLSEIDRLLNEKNKNEQQVMRRAALNFNRKEAARLIAEEILNIGLEHEK